MKTIFLAAFLGFLQPILSFGQSNLTAIDPNCACDSLAKDNFEEPLRFEFGPYKGTCVNSCVFRRSYLATMPEGVISADGTKTGLTNILHNGRYWMGAIADQKIEYADILFEDFFLGVAHVSIRLHFFRPLELTAQTPKLTGPATTKISDLVFSSEAAYGPGKRINLVEGAMGNYLLSHRFLSLEQVHATSVVTLRHSIKQFRLRLNQSQLNALFRSAILKSQRESFRTVYQLLSNNCATSATGLLQIVSGFPPKLLENGHRAVSVSGNYGTLPWLEMVGLLETSIHLPNLEQEFR
ncbi:MAG: DUF4105 domain-containing protein [Bacteriovoracia bacterium]